MTTSSRRYFLGIAAAGSALAASGAFSSVNSAAHAENSQAGASDVAELRAVADDVGMDILGLPLSDEEVPQIIAEAEVS
jgi:hypothetical protein